MENHVSDHANRLGDRLMSIFWRTPTADIAERTRRRVTVHLIPYLFFLYILAYLDRANLSVARLGMEKSAGEGGMGFGPDVTGWGFGVFFWGYWILEIPSTVSVVRWGARWVFVRILILWGICAALAGFIGLPWAERLFTWIPQMSEQHDLGGVIHFFNGLRDDPKYQFYFFRFMLGFFEGGFFPSVIVYLSIWFRTEDRAKAIASFMAAIPISNVIGNPLSGLLLGCHWFDLAGWRWIFILEGIVPVLAGFATLFFLPDRPAKAKWLPADERDWLTAEFDREHQGKLGHGHTAWMNHLGMVGLLTVVYFCLNVTGYGLGSVAPGLMKSCLLQVLDFFGWQLGEGGARRFDQFGSYLTAPVFIMAFIGILLNGRHSDRTGERIWHVAVPLSLYGLGLSLAAAFGVVPLVPMLAIVFIVGTFMYAHLPAFWPIPTMFLGATAAASAIGFINMIGNLGGSLGSMVVGKLLKTHEGYSWPLAFLAPWPLVAAAIILIVGYVRRRVPVKDDPR